VTSLVRYIHYLLVYYTTNGVCANCWILPRLIQLWITQPPDCCLLRKIWEYHSPEHWFVYNMYLIYLNVPFLWSVLCLCGCDQRHNLHILKFTLIICLLLYFACYVCFCLLLVVWWIKAIHISFLLSLMKIMSILLNVRIIVSTSFVQSMRNSRSHQRWSQFHEDAVTSVAHRYTALVAHTVKKLSCEVIVCMAYIRTTLFRHRDTLIWWEVGEAGTSVLAIFLAWRINCYLFIAPYVSKTYT